MRHVPSFCADHLFKLLDCHVPQQTVEAMKGLLGPLERLFPDGRVPSDETLAVSYLSGAAIPPPSVLELPFFKKDWIEWIQFEIETRLNFSVRFLGLRAIVEEEQALSETPRQARPIILLLREFRTVRHLPEARMFGFRRSEGDHQLRDRVERLFPDAYVIWMANVDDALSYSFYVLDGEPGDAEHERLVQRINPNTLPYLASHDDWVTCARALADAADLIVMSNTKSDGGVAAEVELIKADGHLAKTFFSDPAALGLPSNRGIDALAPKLLEAMKSGRHERLLALPDIKPWVGKETLAYAAAYVGAIDRLWGRVQDDKITIAPAVFSALLTSISTLMLIRGELKGAAQFYEAVANVVRARPAGLGRDAIAEQALRKAANWYSANAELYSLTYLIQFEPS